MLCKHGVAGSNPTTSTLESIENQCKRHSYYIVMGVFFFLLPYHSFAENLDSYAEFFAEFLLHLPSHIIFLNYGYHEVLS